MKHVRILTDKATSSSSQVAFVTTDEDQRPESQQIPSQKTVERRAEPRRFTTEKGKGQAIEIDKEISGVKKDRRPNRGKHCEPISESP
jgi:hypothetical protein